MTPAELLIEWNGVTVYRLHGRPREPVEGRHCRLVCYSSVETSPWQLVGLLREAADQLAKKQQVTE